MAYIETPRTDPGNATFLTNGHNIENFSPENSFYSPSKNKNDLISQLRSNRGLSLNTPRTRLPFTDRHNLPIAPTHGEFTPLLKSVAKKNLLRNSKLSGAPQTPAFLRAGYQSTDSPALPGADISAIYGDDTGSSVGNDDEGTPIPRIASSSAQSTPLAVLPKRDSGAVLTEQGNMMTLREQENIINKIEKENFGLKLKIFYLEESLRKTGPGFNEAALKENTELKVDKITMQKELSRTRKTLNQAGRDLEAYRLHLQEVQEKTKRKHVDEGLRDELESLRSNVMSKESEIEELTKRLNMAEGSEEEMKKLKDDIKDLEADIREKDRCIEERDDLIDGLKEQTRRDVEEINELEEELETVKKHNEELKGGQEKPSEEATKLKIAQDELQDMRISLQDLESDVQRAEAEAETAKNEVKEALDLKEKAEEDRDELRDEMANKSFSTKGLSRQLEDKANKLQSDLAEAREEHAKLQDDFDNKSREMKRLQEKIRDAKQDAEVREQRLSDENELLRHESEVTLRKRDSLASQVQQLTKELQSKSEEKDLLHTRHDALTTESQVLQRDLSKAQTRAQELQQSWEDERQHALDNDLALRSQAKDELDALSEEIDNLHRQLEDKESQEAGNHDHWESQRRNLQSQKEKAEERANGLQRTVDKLQEIEGTLSSREMKLQEALESEKHRHQSEEAVLNRQLQELESEMNERRQDLDDLRSEASRTREELRVSKRDCMALEEKVEALEDEIEVLQSGLDEEAENSKGGISAARQEAETLRRQLHAMKQELTRAETAHANAQAEIETIRDSLHSGHGSKEQLTSHLRDVEAQLQRVKTEKQSLQDQLANANIEMHASRTSCAEIEAERNEMQSQLKQMENQVDETFKLDQEKIELRTKNLKLDHSVGRLREERNGLLEKTEAIEKELEEEIKRATVQEGCMTNEITDLRSKLAAAVEGRDRELVARKQKIQRLEIQIEKLEGRVLEDDQNDEVAAELDVVRRDLSVAQKKETEQLQREASYKENIRELKQRVTGLERQIRETELSRLISDSPKSSVGGSSRKDEVIEVRHLLAEAHQQIKNLRTKYKETEREAKRKVADADREVRLKEDANEQQREQLEQELVDCRLQQQEQAARNTTAEQTVARLRVRIHSLEKDMHTARLNTTGDRTMAEERKDLHEMLKDAKIEAEDLQVQISDREARIESASLREKDLRSQLRRVRQERTHQLQKATALTTELGHLQSRYERALDNFTRQQQGWEEERKSIVSRVRSTNMSISSVHDVGNSGHESTEIKQLEDEIQEKEKRHQGELRGLAKQMQWMRAKCTREQGFRSGLAYEKKYLLMQIDMFQACNKVDLHLLEEMGVRADPKVPTRKLTLKIVGIMVLASVKIKRMQVEWAGQKMIQASLEKNAEQIRRPSRKISGR